MNTYFPAIEPYATHQLAVTPPHVLYIEESGNPNGLPILFVHGGPGGGTNPQQRCFFDPAIYRIILFDQRGSGLSTPHAELSNNTTQDLVADIELIREYLKIKEWVVFGGSWGSTLSLVYAQAHPDRVLGLILRGIFLCNANDKKWFFEYGTNQIFPDHWESFIKHIPENERHDLVKAYYKRLTSTDHDVQLAAAIAWAAWEGSTSSLRPNPALVSFFTEPHHAISIARIEAHYFINNCFLEENQIIKNMPRIKHIPGIIVHGRYDMVCSPASAWDLYKAWPGSELIYSVDAGHAASEPSNTDALIAATNRMGQMFKK